MGVSTLGQMDLILKDAGVKINGACYCEVFPTPNYCLSFVRSLQVLYLQTVQCPCCYSMRLPDDEFSVMTDTCNHFTGSVATQQQDLNPVDYKMSRNAAASLQSSYC